MAWCNTGSKSNAVKQTVGQIKSQIRHKLVNEILSNFEGISHSPRNEIRRSLSTLASMGASLLKASSAYILLLIADLHNFEQYRLARNHENRKGRRVFVDSKCGVIINISCATCRLACCEQASSFLLLLYFGK